MKTDSKLSKGLKRVMGTGRKQSVGNDGSGTYSKDVTASCKNMPMILTQSHAQRLCANKNNYYVNHIIPK